MPNESANSENAPGVDPDASSLVGPGRDAKQELYAECVERLNNSARGLIAKIRLAAASDQTDATTDRDYSSQQLNFETGRLRNVFVGKLGVGDEDYSSLGYCHHSVDPGAGLYNSGAMLSLWTTDIAGSDWNVLVGTRQEVELTAALDPNNPLLIGTTRVSIELDNDYVPDDFNDTLMGLPWSADELAAPNFFDSGPRWIVRMSQQRILLPEEIVALAHELGTAFYNDGADGETDHPGDIQRAKFDHFAKMVDNDVTITAFFCGTKVMDQAVIKWDQLGYLRQFVDGSGGLASLLADAAD